MAIFTKVHMRNKRYIGNDLKIKNAFIEILKNEKRMPAQEEVAKIVGLTRETVNKHLRQIKLSDLVEPFKIFGNDVLIGLRDKAMMGDERAAKLFFKLVFDWAEKHELKAELDGDLVFKVEYVDASRLRDKKD